MPLFPFIETSGLTPLELPPSLTNLARPTNGVQTRPTPSPESIARFQAAMSEPPTVQRMAAPLAPQEPVAAAMPPRETAPAGTVAAVVATAVTEPPSSREAPVLMTSPLPDAPTVQRMAAPLAPQEPVAAATPPRETAPAGTVASVAATAVTETPPAATAVTEPTSSREAPVLTSTPLPDAPTVQRVAAPLAPQEPVAPATPPRERTPAATAVTETAIPAHPPIGGGQPVANVQRPTDDIQLPKPPLTIEKPNADEQVADEPNVAIPQLQAAPVTAPFIPSDASLVAAPASVALEIDPAAATARTHELVEAATQVADTILVTPSLVRGEGEITIQLKPTVLDGSEIRLEAKGSSITVAITPATPSAAQVIVQAKVQFEQTLAERIPSFQIAVSVESLNLKTNRRKETII